MSTADRSLLQHRDHVTLEASPQKAWDAIKNFDSIHTWHPAAESTEMLVGENGKPLAVREFQATDGGFVISERLEYAEAKRWFRYRIIKSSFPIHGYVGEMHVVPTDDGGSEVHWSAQCDRPDEASPTEGPTLDEMVHGIVRSGLDNLRIVVN